MDAKNRALAMFKANLNSAINKSNYEIKKMLPKDAKVLKQEIEKSFEENCVNIPLQGYYLDGKGPVLPEGSGTDVYSGEYYPDWEKPRVYITPHGNDGVYITATGKDIYPLEYGSGIDGMRPDLDAKNLFWVHDSNEGYYNAHNRYGGGNWYEAIELVTGNQQPLISKGEPGTRFFSLGNKPTYFVSKAIDSYNDKVNRNSAELLITQKGIAGYIKKELMKGIK